jgi:hypothetical protein
MDAQFYFNSFTGSDGYARVENSKQKKGDADDRHGRSRGMQATGFKAF